MSFSVETTIPHGNACDIEINEAGELPVISFTPDPHGGPEVLWFCLRVRRTGPAGERVRLVLKHFDSMLGCGEGERLRPVARAEGGEWERLGPGEVSPAADGRRTVAWALASPETFVDVAVCYPYGTKELTSLISDTNGFWKCTTIGVSQAGRPLVRLSNRDGEEGDTRPGLYLIARQHSGETPGSWVLDGLLRHLAEAGARELLVQAVPLSNVDGVEGGDYGKDNFPYDLNRAWGSPAMRHEVLVIQRDMGRWRTRCRPALAIDLHAPGACESDGVYCYLPDPAVWPDEDGACAGWVERIGSALTPQYASARFARVARYRSRWETPTFTSFGRGIAGLRAFSMETPYALCGETVLTVAHYRRIGARMGAAVLAGLAQPRT